MKAAAASISASKAGITQSASSHSGGANGTSLALPTLSVAPLLSNGGSHTGTAQSSVGSSADDQHSATPTPTASSTPSENSPAPSASDDASANAKNGDSQKAPASPAASASATASGGDRPVEEHSWGLLMNNESPATSIRMHGPSTPLCHPSATCTLSCIT
ncbi:hypothetical protein FKP32DRAFT_437473 [Trametes sanguinea]|nr:hypothetical protein FKP32DRAFT_437473 [Trametes sanguinea]